MLKHASIRVYLCEWTNKTCHNSTPIKGLGHEIWVGYYVQIIDIC